ncbi:DUF443 family protein [Gracilibacillus suaedae]|uniref:DUF443 family protein n=1 Tax=Gracilibacillus suaedae TaxID=2820273 RepID=UPI001ABEB0AB|nr:DUF443 family protein [Gracilibacillus suaedae]
MECEVQRIKNNPRFRILKIEGNTYTLDMNQSIWKILFPFLTWLTPNSIYQIEEEIEGKLSVLQNEPTDKKIGTITLGFLSVAIANNFLSPLTDYLELESTLMFNIILSVVVIALVLLLRFYFSNRNKQKLYRVFNQDKLSKRCIWIRPTSFKHFLQSFFYYIVSLGISVLFFIVFIQEGHLVPLICATTFFIAVSLANGTTVLEPSTNVKFDGDFMLQD